MLHCTSPLSLDLISSILFSSHAIYGSIIYFAYIIILQVCFFFCIFMYFNYIVIRYALNIIFAAATIFMLRLNV